MLLSKSVMVGYDRHSETERVLVSYDELTILNLLKIQSVLIGNYKGYVGRRNEHARSTIISNIDGT